jgi:hypothetical protein
METISRNEVPAMDNDNIERGTDDMPEPNSNNENEYFFELGDMHHFIAATNNVFHEQTFLVTYVDENIVKLLNINTYQLETLTFDENNNINDESITSIYLLSRNPDKGFARQNNLVPNTWVDIHFGGEITTVIMGKITNLEGDMIEVTSFPANEVYYIDFEYKGLLEHLEIEKIVIREPPRNALLAAISSTSESAEYISEGDLPEKREASITYTEDGESIITIPDEADKPENIRDVLQSIYLDANELFGEDLTVILQDVEVPEYEKRYTIDTQVTDFTDELLSTIPNSQRTASVMKRVHHLVERFKQLRQLYSSFDTNGNITGKKTFGKMYKPLIDHIINLDTKLTWLIPVVKQQTKMYETPSDEDLADVINYNKLDTELSAERDVHTQYYKNINIGDENKYKYFNERINQYMRPFLPPRTSEELLSFNQNVKHDLDVIINNLGDFFSHTSTVGSQKNAIVSRHRFLMERYVQDITSLKSMDIINGERQYTSEPIMRGDKISVQSLVTLPTPIMKYSRVHLPSTNIYDKTRLSQVPFQYGRLLRNKQNIHQHIVDNLDYETNYVGVDDENENKIDEGQTNKNPPIDILNNMTEFVLDDSLHSEPNKYKRMLTSIIPNTRSLIRMIRPSLGNKMSLIEVIRELEPYQIYPNNISYGAYNEIRFFIKQVMIEYKKSLTERGAQFAKIKNTRYKYLEHDSRNIVEDNRILRILHNKKELGDIFHDTYYKKYKDLNGDMIYMYKTSVELLNQIIQKDCMSLYTNLITFMLFSLITPNKILDAFNNIAADNDLSASENPEKCIRRFLAKKYASIADLQKDNNVSAIYYDKNLDDTPYDILKKYDKERKEMLPEKFLPFLAENLIQKHDCPRAQSMELAKTLIDGKKQVSEGEYATVEIKVADNNSHSSEQNNVYYMYYVRKNNHWIEDESLLDINFVDTNTLFCNIDFNCFKNNTTNTCDPAANAKLREKQVNAKRALEEFDQRYIISAEELMEKIKREYTHNVANIQKLDVLRNNDMYKYNFVAHSIGKYANKGDIVTSPYLKYVDLLLAEPDFVTRQVNIATFVRMFCREAIESSDKAEQLEWLYCKETNTKLFPKVLFDLACSYNNGEDYLTALELACSKYGRLSDDGDAIVDVTSGRVLRKIDYVSEEGYDESGYKIISNAILEKDLGTVAEEIIMGKKVPVEKRVFEDATSDLVYNIFYTLCRNMEIDGSLIESFVLRTTVNMITNKDIVLNEAKYNKKLEKADKKTEKLPPPYNIYYNQTIITIVGCVLIVALQTSIPSIKANKTFPGCVRSFSGYPLDGGVEDLTGIKYIACVMTKTASEITPWDAIYKKLSSSVLEKRIQKVIADYLVENNEIKEMYIAKREYVILNPEKVTIEEHSVSKWKHFMPPVVEFSTVKGLNGVSREYDGEFSNLLKKGHKDIGNSVNVYKSNIIRHTYGVIELINEIVKTEDLLLKTTSQKPFVENACCNNDPTQTYPIPYFIKKNNNIDLFIKRSLKNVEILRNMNIVSMAGLLFNDQNTSIKRPTIPIGIIDSNIYLAYIRYCNFDNDLPIPEDLMHLCGEKPAGFPMNASIPEKIEYLKLHGKKYDASDFHHLMTRVNRRNEIQPYREKRVDTILMLQDYLETLDRKNSTLIEEPLRRLLADVIEQHNPKVWVSQEDKTATPFNRAMIRLRNWVSKMNEKMHSAVMTFFDKYSNLSTNEYNHIQTFVLELTQWKSDKSIIETGLAYDSTMFSVITFIKNSIYQMTKLFPNTIINKVKYSSVPKHWGLSANHQNDIQKMVATNFNDKIQKYMNNDTLKNYLSHINEWATDMNMFIDLIPIENPINSNGELCYSLFDKRTLYMIFSYCWYSTIYEFIRMCDSPELIQYNIQESKRARKINIIEKRDLSNTISSSGGALVGLDADAGEYNTDLMQVEIQTGNVVALKQLVGSLLVDYIKIDTTIKKSIDLPYNMISRKTSRTKKQEEDSIIAIFDNMEKDERNIEKMLQKFKIDRWNVGQQAGLFMYDKSEYDRNREGRLTRLYEELTADDTIPNIPQAMGVDDLVALEEQEQQELYDAEGTDIGVFGEDYTDGVYYREDEDRDFGYDD